MRRVENRVCVYPVGGIRRGYIILCRICAGVVAENAFRLYEAVLGDGSGCIPCDSISKGTICREKKEELSDGVYVRITESS